MIINFDVQIHWSWFKHQDLSNTNAKKEVNLGSILQNQLFFNTIIKRLLVTGNKYTLTVKSIYVKK